MSFGRSDTYTSNTSTSTCPVRDLNKHKVAISTSMSSMGDPNKHKSVISKSNYISSLYECKKILIYITAYLLLFYAPYK